jgi:hypothetical protein
MWEKFDCVGYSFAVGRVDVAHVAVIVFKRWAKVPTKFSMGIPKSSLAWFLMEYHFGTWGHEWVTIELKQAEEYLVGGYVGLSSRGSQKVEGDLCLWQQAIPKTEWKIRMCGAEPCNKVILEGLNGSFGHVVLVDCHVWSC